MAQMGLAAASILTNYDVEFGAAEGNGEAVEQDLRDQLTASPGKLRLVFQRRES